MTTGAVSALTGMVPLAVAGGIATSFTRSMSPADREERRRSFKKRFSGKRRQFKTKPVKRQTKPKNKDFRRRKF